MGVLLKLNLLLLLVFIERKSSCKVVFYCFTPELQTLPSAPNADLPVLSRSLEGVLFCFVFVEFFFTVSSICVGNIVSRFPLPSIPLY